MPLVSLGAGVGSAPQALSPFEEQKEKRAMALCETDVSGTAYAGAGATATQPPPDARARLLPLSSTLGHPAVARPGLFAWPIRFIRRVMKGFFRPWLDLQTRFNHTVIETFEHNQNVVRAEVAVVAAAVAQTSAALARQLQCLQERLDAVSSSGEQATQAGKHALVQATRILESRWDDRLAKAEARLEERLARTEAFWQQQAEQRLGQVADQAEQQLSDAEARWAREAEQAAEKAVNRELSYEGRIAQAGLFFNPAVHVGLVNKTPHVFGISERILEHIYVHTRLPAPPARLLDLGCAESINPIEMASLGFHVVGVDMRTLPLSHPNFEMVQANLISLPFPDDSFDVVVGLSTIEHVGLGWYGKAEEDETDFKAAQEAFRVLRPGGRMILTVPFGKAGQTPVHRIYDRARLDELVRPFRRVETAYGLREMQHWTFSLDAARAEATDSVTRVSAIALLVLEKP
jgi:SAM-dependent methyltransferase